MVSAFASSSLGVPRWEVSVVLRLFVRDCDLLKQKGKGGWGRQGLDSRGNELQGACLEARWAIPAITRVLRPETRHSNAYTILGTVPHIVSLAEWLLVSSFFRYRNWGKSRGHVLSTKPGGSDGRRY